MARTQFFGIFITLFCLKAGLLGCTSESVPGNGAESGSRWEKVEKPFSYQNVQVPRELWQTIKEVLRQGGASEDIIDNFVVFPVSINVDLMSDNPITLKQGLNYRIMYVEGGGELDLFDYVVGKGPFFIRFVPELSADKPIHLLYVSQSPGKEVEGKAWGNGCGQIYDLSEATDRFIYENGIPVTSSRRHYLHLMAGTYVFFQRVDERLFLSYIRLTDSRYPSFNCRELE